MSPLLTIMHIGIDARLYGTHHRGIGRYTEQLVLHLAAQQDNHRYTLFVAGDVADSLTLDPNRFAVKIADVPHYSVSEHVRMPGLIRTSGVDIMHFTHLNVPYWCPVPYAVTIHDLIVLHFPTTRASHLPGWKYKLKVAGYNCVLKNAVSRAQKIIAVSEFTKRDIVRHLGAPQEKIQVTHLAVPLPTLPSVEACPRQSPLPGTYLLYVGSAYPHKNLERLIDAYVLLAGRYKRNWQLVLAGRHDAFYKRVIEYADKVAPSAEIRRNIVFTGEVSESELSGLYRGAKCFVLPSLYEGFGLPCLEAAQAGVPVVCSKAASLPEVMASGAAYFDPENAASIAAALNKVGGSHAAAQELSLLGKERAQRFSWKKTAQQTVDVYNSFVV